MFLQFFIAGGKKNKHQNKYIDNAIISLKVTVQIFRNNHENRMPLPIAIFPADLREIMMKTNIKQLRSIIH